MASKIVNLICGLIVFVFVILFIADTIMLVHQYNKRTMMRDTEWMPQNELPFPSLAICLDKPINELMISPSNVGSGVGGPRFIKYVRNVLTPLNPEEDRLPMTEQEMTAAALEFTRFINSTGRNLTSMERIMHVCDEVVLNCSIGGKDFNGQQCCAKMVYAPTPMGVCQVYHSEESQESPGLKNGMRFRFRIDEYVNKGLGQGDKNGFHVFMFDKELPLSSIQDPISLESGLGYRVLMELGSKKRMAGDCKMHLGWNKKRERIEMKEADQERFQCLESRIQEKCGCVPIFSLWKESAMSQESAAICTTNQTEHCAIRWLEDWKLDMDAEMDWRSAVNEKNRLCKPKIPCDRLFWNWEETSFPIQVKLGSIESEIWMFYRHMVVKLETGRLTMSLENLLYNIGLVACILFVVFRILCYVVCGIQSCLCGKKKTERVVEPENQNHPEMTGIVAGGDKYQQTQTED